MFEKSFIVNDEFIIHTYIIFSSDTVSLFKRTYLLQLIRLVAKGLALCVIYLLVYSFCNLFIFSRERFQSPEKTLKHDSDDGKDNCYIEKLLYRI